MLLQFQQKVKISHARPIKQNQRQREDDVIYNHLFERGVAAEQEEYYDHALPVHNGLNIDPEYYGTVVIERDNCVEDPATHGQSQTFHIVDNRIEETNMLENNAYFILENEGQWGPYWFKEHVSLSYLISLHSDWILIKFI